MFRRLWEKMLTLWRLAVAERASPREIGWAVALGAFAGCTPAIGAHSVVALGLATLFRKNRLFAWLGSRVSNFVFMPFIIFAEIEVAHRLRTGTWVALDFHHARKQASDLLLDWCLGTFPVGGVIALAMGLASWTLAERRDRRRVRQNSGEG